MLPFSRFPMTFSIVRTAAFHARGSHVSPSFAQYVRLTTHKIQHGARRPNPTNIIVANRRDLEAKWSQGLKQQRDTLSKEIQKAKCSLSKRIEGGYAVLVKQSDDFIKQRERESQELLKNLDLKEQHLEEAIENGIKEIRRLDGLLLIESTERERWEANFNVRGAIEYIIYRAEKEDKIKKVDTGGINASLKQLVTRKDVQTALYAEAAARKLRGWEVKLCIRQVYHRLSLCAHGHDGEIVIEERFHEPNERAGLVALMKVQDTWKKPVVWREERSEQEDKKSLGC